MITPYTDIENDPIFRRMMDAGKGNAAIFQNIDAATSGGMAFLVSELTKRDNTLYEPLTAVQWPRDIDPIIGGGWVDFTELLFSKYTNSAPNEYGLSANSTTEVPSVGADLVKETYPVYNWQNNMQISHIDLQKAETVGRRIDTLLEEAIKLNYQKAIEKMVYVGFFGNPGLLNNPYISATSATAGSSGSTQWVGKTADEILADVNLVQLSTIKASQYDESGMASHILIPWDQWSYINQQKVSLAADKSILKYLRENNLATAQGMQFDIFPCRWCTGAGTGGSDRMAAYVKNKRRVQFDLPVGLTRVMTQPDLTQGIRYKTAYAAQIGVVKFTYTQAAVYVDMI